MKTDAFTLRIGLLRFPLVFMVVLIHTYDSVERLDIATHGQVAYNFYVELLRNFISQGIARTAVPMFYLIAGYLFFFQFKPSVSNYFRKLRSRIDTLLIPFLFWNSVVCLCFLTAQNIPISKGYFSGAVLPIISLSFFEFIDVTFGITRHPISYQFWFIRDLMILVALTPLIGLVIKSRLGSLIVAILAILWIIDSWPFYIPSFDAIVFFVLGSFMSTMKFDLNRIDRYGLGIFILYICLSIADSVLMTINSYNISFHRICLILGVVSIIYLSGKILCYRSLSIRLCNLSHFSFFVFAAHEPTLTIAKKLSYHTPLYSTPLFLMLTYLILPTILVLLLVFVWRIASKHLSRRLILLVNGGKQ